MKKLFALALIAAPLALAGCAGVKIDGALMTDCMVQCLTDQPIKVINKETGQEITIYPGDYKNWIWHDDGTVEFKDKR